MKTRDIIDFDNGVDTGEVFQRDGKTNQNKQTVPFLAMSELSDGDGIACDKFSDPSVT